MDRYTETFETWNKVASLYEEKFMDLSKRQDFKIFAIDIAPKMIEFAKKNNPSANFDVMDSRDISNLGTQYDGIVCGFCIPYMSQTDCIKLISDCYKLLNAGGLIYLSFVEGEPNKSGFQVGSTGDRAYFYFHRLRDITEQLTKVEFGEINVAKVEYQKTATSIEMHTIVTARKKARS